MSTSTVTTLNPAQLDQLSINTIRFLSVDAVQKANSGHPGLPLGAAPMAYVLWTRFLQHNPSNPHWFNRDRFVLSAGHGSMLLYSLLHLTGYDLPLEQIKGLLRPPRSLCHPTRIELLLPWGTMRFLFDDDLVFPLRKVQPSGLWKAVEGLMRSERFGPTSKKTTGYGSNRRNWASASTK